MEGIRIEGGEVKRREDGARDDPTKNRNSPLQLPRQPTASLRWGHARDSRGPASEHYHLLSNLDEISKGPVFSRRTHLPILSLLRPEVVSSTCSRQFHWAASRTFFTHCTLRSTDIYLLLLVSLTSGIQDTFSAVRIPAAIGSHLDRLTLSQPTLHGNR